MNALDIALLAIISVSAIIGAIKGLIRQMGVIVAVILGVALALKYGSRLSEYLAPHIRSGELRNILAPFLIFLLVYLATILVANLLHQIMHKISLGWINRLAGALFGAASAAIPIGAILLLVVAYVPSGRPNIAQSSVAIHMMKASQGLLNLMPDEAKEAFNNGKVEIENLLKRYKRIPGSKNEAVI